MRKTPDITRLIHENFWIVVSYAFARPVVSKVIDDRFHGEWKYLRKSTDEYAEIRADRALLEMGTQIRVLDDEQRISEYLKQTKSDSFGIVVQGDGSQTDMHLRDMTNKIVHSAAYQWNFANSDDPMIICLPHDKERWHRAEIRILALMAFIGGLMF